MCKKGGVCKLWYCCVVFLSSAAQAFINGFYLMHISRETAAQAFLYFSSCMTESQTAFSSLKATRTFWIKNNTDAKFQPNFTNQTQRFSKQQLITSCLGLS